MLATLATAVLVGAVIGALGRLVLPGRQEISVLMTALVGFMAALVGTAVTKAFGFRSTGDFNWIELAVQVLLAAVAVGAVVGPRTPGTVPVNRNGEDPAR